MSKPRIPLDQRHSVYPGAKSAVDVLSVEANVDREKAQQILRALIEAGFVIAPREPTNAMLDAYLVALGPERPSRHRSIILNNIGKARKRWRAMGQAGTMMALSMRDIQDQSTESLDG